MNEPSAFQRSFAAFCNATAQWRRRKAEEYDRDQRNVRAAHALEDSCGARQHLCHALEIAQESGVVLPLLWALPATALLLAGEGESERAVELYALASRFPLVAKSRWFADVAGNTLSEVAAALPAERVAVLQERSRTRDLEATVAELLSELCR